MKKEMLLGSEAIAYGVKLSRPMVISAYPITPQTHIIETLANMTENGELNAKFIKVESELSAISSCYGAAAAGVRTFTATASQGLLLMHEMLHWFSGARLPMVLVNANRAVGYPWNIWTDQSDSFAQRDTGWLQIYCTNAQEAQDFIPIAYKISESINLPVMVAIDGFILSHTLEPLMLRTQEDIDRFLPKYVPKYFLDTDNPQSFGNATMAESFYKMKKSMNDAMLNWNCIDSVLNEFNDLMKTDYKPVECYRTDDADKVFLATGALCGTAKVAVDLLRERGSKIGLINVRFLRPLPKKQIIEAVKDKKIWVLNRAVSYGNGGTLTGELKSALFPMNNEIIDVIVSLGGKDVYPKTLTDLLSIKDTEKTVWLDSRS